MTAKDAALFYRGLGFNPLPSSRIRRHPVFPYSHLWETLISRDLLSSWPVEAANVQLMCGQPWGLVVVDLDGPGALDAWEALTLHRPVPRTWTVRTGAGGTHLYFRIPSDQEEIPRAVLWRGSSQHEAIEVLGSRSLVVAPPSLHHRTGEPYQFIDMPRLAPLPAWIADLAHTAGRAAPCDLQRSGPNVHQLVPRKGPHFDRKAVLDAIRDKVSLVRSWGLRVIGRRPSPRGWLACRSLDREDRHPSCGFHHITGYYCEPADRLRLSLFEVGARLGAFASWIEACNTLGDIYL